MRRLLLRASLVLVASFVFPGIARAQLVHPGEFEPSSEILWGCNDTSLVADVYRESIKGTVNEPVNHVFFVDSKESAYQVLYDCYDNGISVDKAKFFICTLDTVWIRDYGPLVLRDGAGYSVLDFNYYPGRDADDSFPKLWAKFKGYGYRYADLDYEGGNFMTNGKGVGYGSRSIYTHNTHLTKAQVDAIFKTRFACSEVQTFESLVNDGTTHVDMYSKLLGPGTVLVSRAVSTKSKNHALIERNVAKFKALGFNVVRATMADDDLSTYTNSLIVGKTALVPIYKSPRDAAALQVYQQAGYNAVGIDSREIIRYGGAVHCVSMQVAR